MDWLELRRPARQARPDGCVVRLGVVRWRLVGARHVAHEELCGLGLQFEPSAGNESDAERPYAVLDHRFRADDSPGGEWPSRLSCPREAAKSMDAEYRRVPHLD